MKKLIILYLCTASLVSGAQKTDFSWLSGRWVGPGFGGVFEEVWSEPDAKGNMMGMFRYADSTGVVQFYEFWVLDESGMKLKHFDPNLTSWEEKTEFMEFPMIKSADKKLILKGLTYERIGKDQMEIHLDLKHEGEVTSEVFVVKRQ